MRAERLRLETLAGLLLLLFFLTAFLVIPGTRDAYTGWIFSRVIALLVLGLLGSLLITRKVGLGHLPWGIWALSLYFLGVLLSVLLSPDEKTFVLVGHEERYDGLLYQLSLFSWLIAVTGIYNVLSHTTFVRLTKIGFVILGVVQAVLLYAFLFFKLDIVGALLYGGAKNNYPIGTFGFKALLTLAIATAAFALVSFYRGRWTEKLGIATLGPAIGLAAGRAALIGALTATTIGAFLAKDRSKKTLLIVLLALIVLGGIARDPLARWLNEKEAKVVSTHTLRTRLKIWDLSFYLIRKHHGLVLFGYGPDALRYLLIKELPKDEVLRQKLGEFLRLEERLPTKRVESIDIALDPTYGLRSAALRVHYRKRESGKPSVMLSSVLLDKAHNLFLDKWLRYGLLAAIAYVIFAFGTIGHLIFSRRSPEHLWLTLVMVLHFFHYLAWFSMPLWEPYFLTLSLLAWFAAQRTSVE